MCARSDGSSTWRANNLDSRCPHRGLAPPLLNAADGARHARQAADDLVDRFYTRKGRFYTRKGNGPSNRAENQLQ